MNGGDAERRITAGVARRGRDSLIKTLLIVECTAERISEVSYQVNVLEPGWRLQRV